ncbi:sugar-transfer associated ATP-grasp domain-containing protein [Pseudobutyrivibrio xylanivorans]|uniref:Alpha-L-glutamate ligase-related protein ATP-grasp domain-containing protein n=1 Tax=Pseudobutyrivibrio xylanivorans TaxID=185007 RepID=A0A5P6VUF5_PSEXY|nr:sugar-transfer associated ATP-grasp domain-containing protein [Pseudobutyrivibrio xylanivorans]QFJ56090.1 hypothetical protein FXF36_14960 [Pseudobutyrivibrio xylanivorans]
MKYIDRYIERKKYYQTSKGTFISMIVNYILFGSSINDYFMYRFYELPWREKSTYITCKKHKKIQLIENNTENKACFIDKSIFNEIFQKYIKREWIDIDKAHIDEIQEFIDSHIIFFKKDKTGCEGKGVERIENNKLDAIQIKNEWGGYLLEEAVYPCIELSEFCPDSLNTLRITCLRTRKNSYEIISAVLRMSSSGPLDNLYQGAIIADVDVNTGEVLTSAVNRKGEEFAIHPLTGKKIKGFRIPQWENVISMVKEMNGLVPGVGYIGWDMAITADRGVLVIEGNDCADHDVPQLAKRKGMWNEVREKLPHVV